MKTALRYLLSLLMIAVGVTHFVDAPTFEAMVPAYLPYPLALVYISGFFEILGGIGLSIPRSSRAAAWGLVALYVSVFPANLNMAVNQISPPGQQIPAWILWARLPLQALFIAWAFWYTRSTSRNQSAPGRTG